MNLRPLEGRQLGNIITYLRHIADNLHPADKQYAAALIQIANVIADPRASSGCERCGDRLPTASSAGGRPRKYCVRCSPRKTSGKLHP